MLRNKQGTLQLYTDKKWKDYMFKVTGNMYLHYFKLKRFSNSSPPIEQIFLSNIVSVAVPSSVPNGSSHVFTIKHSGKSSPWTINAATYEERTEWMEAILPGSTQCIAKKPPPLNKALSSIVDLHNAIKRHNHLSIEMPGQCRPLMPQSYSLTNLSQYATGTESVHGSDSDCVSSSLVTKHSTRASKARSDLLIKQTAITDETEDEYVDMRGLVENGREPDYANVSSSRSRYVNIGVGSNFDLRSDNTQDDQQSWGSNNGELECTDHTNMTAQLPSYKNKELCYDYVDVEKTFKAKFNTHKSKKPSCFGDYTEIESCPVNVATSNNECSYVVQELYHNFTEDQIFSLEHALQKGPTTATSQSLGHETTLNVTGISCQSLTDMAMIGSGHFGDIYRAVYSPKDSSHDNCLPVVIKVVHTDHTEEEGQEFLREMAVMAKMIHPNIVRLYGIVTENVASHWIVLEYLPHGDLKSYLCKSEKKSPETLAKYMVDVAMGMHYIAERGLIHRCLAARSVLVGQDELCKITDVGLLQRVTQEDQYLDLSDVPCPVRWTAPEILSDGKFSVASDVWSYGILLWEMLQPTKLPYERMDNLEVAMQVSKGYRMPIPRGCPPVIARIMKACAHADPTKRPSFLLITNLLTTKFVS